jgi:hypothetical protein
MAAAVAVLVLPAAAPARTITGTGKRDVIHGGKGADRLSAGAELTASTAAPGTTGCSAGRATIA